MVQRALALAIALFLSQSAFAAESQSKVFIADVKGPDEFMNQRFRSLFMEELLKLKSVKLVNTRDAADLILEATGQVAVLQKSRVNASGDSLTARGGDVANALVSLTVTDSKGGIVFVGNKSSEGGVMGLHPKGATESAIGDLVSDLKKRMKWK
jgi:hypothetical protein